MDTKFNNCDSLYVSRVLIFMSGDKSGEVGLMSRRSQCDSMSFRMRKVPNEHY